MRAGRPLPARGKKRQNPLQPIDGVEGERRVPTLDDEGADRLRGRDPQARGERRNLLEPPPEENDLVRPRGEHEDVRASDANESGGCKAHRVGRKQAGVGNERRARQVVDEFEAEIVGEHRPVKRLVETERDQLLDRGRAVARRPERRLPERRFRHAALARESPLRGICQKVSAIGGPAPKGRPRQRGSPGSTRLLAEIGKLAPSALATACRIPVFVVVW